MNYAPDLTSAAIKMVLSLGAVLFMVWGLYRLAKKKLPIQSMGGRQKFIAIVESQYVGVKKSIAMVQIPGSILVLGIGSDGVNLLTEINDPEIIESIHSEKCKNHMPSFKEQFQRLIQSKNSRQANRHDDAMLE